MKKTDPSVADIQAAIQVLSHLDVRINLEAVHSLVQLPITKLGNQYATQLVERASDQTLPIKNVCGQLDNWRNELAAQRSDSFDFGSWAERSRLICFFKKLG